MVQSVSEKKLKKMKKNMFFENMWLFVGCSITHQQGDFT